MTSRLLAFASGILLTLATTVCFPAYLLDTTSTLGALADNKYGVSRGRVMSLFLGALLLWVILQMWRQRSGRKSQESIYGLQHGRLHLQASTPMWMNVGYWGQAGESKTMAEACRDLLKKVLKEAGLEKETERAERLNRTKRRKMLIDLGIGCGDQTIYLMSEGPVRFCDREWWDEREHCVHFDHYVGITNDVMQARYASQHVEKLRLSGKIDGYGGEEKERCSISIFNADAATPLRWDKKIQGSIEAASTNCPERWMLALDTAYHFSPSRWAVINYAHKELQASFMAFDLCLSPTATVTQKLVLRILTMLMGAPWANFVTPDDYRQRLAEAGYSHDAIKVVDVSENVFAPLAQYLDHQDSRLKTLGLSLGKFNVAKSLFAWWGRSGVVRGIIVVAKR